MGFGERVSALLETYDNCLSLLKAFKRSSDSAKNGKKSGGSSSRKAARASEQQALLRHSLRADRKKVERAYSSRVSEAGSDFIKGDSKARSVLGKVLRRLNAAIANLMRLASKSPDPLMDYQSLMSLSSTSRVQTIKAFDQLSRRLGSTGSSGSSRGSVVSSSTAASSSSSGTRASSKTTMTMTTTSSKSSRSGNKTAKSDRKRKHSSSKKASVSNNPAPPAAASNTRMPPRTATATHDISNYRRTRERDTGPPRLETSIPTPMLDMVLRGDEEARRRRDDDVSPTLRRLPSLMMNRRFSIRSISSVSTKLGEIPERRWGGLRRRGSDDDWPGPAGTLDEYSAPIVYPLKPYEPAVKERRFMGLFRRGQS